MGGQRARWLQRRAAFLRRAEVAHPGPASAGPLVRSAPAPEPTDPGRQLSTADARGHPQRGSPHHARTSTADQFLPEVRSHVHRQLAQLPLARRGTRPGFSAGRVFSLRAGKGAMRRAPRETTRLAPPRRTRRARPYATRRAGPETDASCCLVNAAHARPTEPEPGNRSSSVSCGPAPSSVNIQRHTAGGLAPITRSGSVVTGVTPQTIESTRRDSAGSWRPPW